MKTSDLWWLIFYVAFSAFAFFYAIYWYYEEQYAKAAFWLIMSVMLDRNFYSKMKKIKS